MQDLHPHHWISAAVVGSASFVDSAAIIAVGAGLPLWRAEFGFSEWTAGLVSSCLTIAIAAGAAAGGYVADRLNRSRVFGSAIALYAVGALLVARAGSVHELLVGIIVLGVGVGADLPASITLIAEHAPDGGRGRVVAFTHVMWTTGVVSAAATAFALSSYGTSGIRAIFAALAAVAVVAAAGRYFHTPLRSAQECPQGSWRTSHRISVRRLLHDWDTLRVLAVITAFYVFFTLVANTFGQFRIYLLVYVEGADQTLATAVSLGASTIGLVGVIAFATIADSRWRHRLYPAGAVALVGSQILIALTIGESFLALLCALALYSVAFPFAGEALYKIWTQESLPPGLRATAQGVTFAVARLCAAAFALVTPALAAFSPAILFGLLAVLGSMSAVFGLWMTRHSGGSNQGTHGTVVSLTR